MFNKNIRFFGKHAILLKKYSNDKSSSEPVNFIVDNNDGEQVNIYLFDTLLNAYMVSSMIGIIEERKVKSEPSSSSEYATIFTEILQKNRDNLNRIYQHMVLSESSVENIDESIKKAFSINKLNDDEEQEKLEDYVRGGLEIIDEIFSGCKTYEDVANCIIDLKDRYSLD